MGQSRESQEIEDVFRALNTTRGSGTWNPLKLFSRFDLFLMGGSLSLFVLSMVLGFVEKYKLSVSRAWTYVGLISLLLALLGAVTLTLRTTFGALKIFIKPLNWFLQIRQIQVSRDYELMKGLRGFSPSALRFVRGRLTLEAEHLRGRIAMLVGAIDKLGILPLLAGGLVSAVDFMAKTKVKMSWLEIALGGYGIIYLIGMQLVSVSHRIDELSQLVECAIAPEEREQDTCSRFSMGYANSSPVQESGNPTASQHI